MQITVAPTWSWPSADQTLIDALHEGALEGLKSVPASAGEVVSAEFFGQSPGRYASAGRRASHKLSPAVRVTVRAPEGERTVEVLLDPGTLGADTPGEARECAASLVAATVGDRPPDDTPASADPDALASGWGYKVMQEMAQVGGDSDPLMTRPALVAGVRELYGDSAVKHERTGSPTGKEMAEGFRSLRRETKRAGHDFAELVSGEIEPVHVQRLNRILEIALEQQIAEHALQSLESDE